MNPLYLNPEVCGSHESGCIYTHACLAGTRRLEDFGEEAGEEGMRHRKSGEAMSRTESEWASLQISWPLSGRESSPEFYRGPFPLEMQTDLGRRLLSAK